MLLEAPLVPKAQHRSQPVWRRQGGGWVMWDGGFFCGVIRSMIFCKRNVKRSNWSTVANRQHWSDSIRFASRRVKQDFDFPHATTKERSHGLLDFFYGCPALNLPYAQDPFDPFLHGSWWVYFPYSCYYLFSVRALQMFAFPSSFTMSNFSFWCQNHLKWWFNSTWPPKFMWCL
jgi:hypothetical protein